MKFKSTLFAVIVITILAMVGTASIFAAAPEPEEETATEGSVKKIDYKKLKNPVPYTKKSIKRGKRFYQNYCMSCHGPDGKALIDVIADATDLTSPKMYLSGTKDGEIFRSIRDGAGVSMPPFSMQIRREEDMWHLVNLIRSMWPKDLRPKLQDDEAIQKAGSSEAKSTKDGGDTHE